MTLGWTFEQFDAAPFPQILKQTEYWADHPPTHELVAAFVGFKPRKGLNRFEKEVASGHVMPYSEIPEFLRKAMESERAN